MHVRLAGELADGLDLLGRRLDVGPGPASAQAKAVAWTGPSSGANGKSQSPPSGGRLRPAIRGPPKRTTWR